MNFLNFLNDMDIKKSCEKIIREYGVGTCGPRAFYGTTDVHLELEQRLAEFLGFEASIVYSYGFVAISSSIAAYCKKSDTVFVDEKVNVAIQQGLQSSRSNVVCFKHNDVESLREEVEKVLTKENGKKRSRKFLIVEGVSWATGKLLPLEEFLKVAEEFKMRVFLEETYSIGVFGDQGKGLTEYFNIDPSRIDMVIATLETAIGSIGGFCVGSNAIIEHQSLSGSGYIFSASLPTYLVKACIEAIDRIGETPKRLQTLSREMHIFLEETCGYIVKSHPESAFKVFTVATEDNIKEKENQIHEYCKKNGVHFLIADEGLVMNLNVALLDDKKKLDIVHEKLKEASAI